MARVTQCDNCRIIGDVVAKGWYVISQTGDQTTGLFGNHQCMEEVGIFCSLMCVSEYSTGRALIESSKDER